MPCTIYSKPDSWRDTVLIQLYKGSGSRDRLDFYKNMHTKLPYCCCNGHRAQDHLFVVKSVMALAEATNIAIVMQLWDLSKYFDRESLKVGINELYKSNVRGKVYKLLYELKKDMQISVRTPVGDKEQRDTGEGWGQGTIEGAICMP